MCRCSLTSHVHCLGPFAIQVGTEFNRDFPTLPDLSMAQSRKVSISGVVTVSASVFVTGAQTKGCFWLFSSNNLLKNGKKTDNFFFLCYLV